MTWLRARKIARDLLAMRGRVALMVVALAAGTGAVGAVLGARAILEREIRASYAATHPASATLAIPGGAGEEALRVVRARPGVLDAALRTRLGARVVLPGGRRAPFLLFVAPASDPMRVAGFTLEQGQWPPASGEMLVERSALAYFGLRVGQTVGIETRDGRHGTARIGGVVHDGAVSPSSQEAVGYAYVTPELPARFGPAPVLDALLIVAGEGARATGDVARIDAVAEDAGSALRARGIVVTRIDAPPPFRHPHQSQMKTATALLLTFAQLALVLGAVLVATMLGGMLAQQTRQIGVMKALGANDGTIFTMYLLMTAAIAAGATLLALVPAMAGARVLARIVGDLFGVRIASVALPPSVFVAEIAAGVLVPLALALVPLVRGTRISVREAIDGMTRGDAAFGTNRMQAWLARVPIGNRAVRLGLRNVVRRPGRLALVVLLLGASGAMYVAALSTAAGMQAIVDQRMAYRHYDLDVRFSGSEDPARVARLLRGAPGVAAFEEASSMPVTTPHGGGIEVTRTYPDGGHGSFALASMRPGTSFVHLPLLEGRGLRDDDDGAVVFNQLVVPQQQHDARIGGDVALSIDGRIAHFRLVGIVSDFGSPATAYVTTAAYARATGERGRVSVVRVVTTAHDGAGRAATIAALRPLFANAGIALRGIVPLGQMKVSLDGHAGALANVLAAIAVLMAVVGLAGLASAIASGVAERTREFGVIRSLGASTGAVVSVVVAEGLLYGVLSAFSALLLAIPLTLLLNGFVGTQAFLVPLPFVLSAQAAGLAGGVAIGASAVVSAVAARAAARITIREALASV